MMYSTPFGFNRIYEHILLQYMFYNENLDENHCSSADY
jgi:hypothetical protein